MNLNNSPTKEQLEEILARHDDRAGDHVLWVDGTGDVHLTVVHEGRNGAANEQPLPELQLRCETFRRGKEYVGPAAAADEEWVTRVFKSLLESWPKAKAKD